MTPGRLEEYANNRKWDKGCGLCQGVVDPEVALEGVAVDQVDQGPGSGAWHDQEIKGLASTVCPEYRSLLDTRK